MKMNYFLQRSRAVRLRKSGLSYGEILKKIPVAKSSISLWCRDVDLTVEHKKRIENKRWIDVRKLELKLNQNNKENKNEVNGAAKAVEIESIEESPGIKIVQLVKSLDPGDGADINNIISKSERKDAEKI